MSTEYILSYTAKEIDKKLGQIVEIQESELLSLLLEEDIVNPASVDGSVLFTNNDNAVYIL